MNFLHDFHHNKPKFFKRVLLIIAGSLLYSVALNRIIVPLNLYSGGFVGASQLLNIFFQSILHTNANLRGIIYFIINIPLFIVARRVMGKEFCFSALLSIGFSSLCISLMPIPDKPLLSDTLTSVLIGGVIAGAGVGMVLRSGSASGGQEILGVCLSKTHPNFKIGVINIIMNLLIYLVCLLLFNLETVVYSLIYSVFVNLSLDRIYVQNINVEAIIFTKKDGVAEKVIAELKHGATYWNGTGTYTHEDTKVIVTVISKYELPALEKVVRRADKKAFIVVNEVSRIYGNFKRHLS